jgi:hypothetical protein
LIGVQAQKNEVLRINKMATTKYPSKTIFTDLEIIPESIINGKFYETDNAHNDQYDFCFICKETPFLVKDRQPFALTTEEMKQYTYAVYGNDPDKIGEDTIPRVRARPVEGLLYAKNFSMNMSEYETERKQEKPTSTSITKYYKK